MNYRPDRYWMLTVAFVLFNLFALAGILFLAYAAGRWGY
jgi:hypothetical protein